MKKIFILCISVILLASCSASEESVTQCAPDTPDCVDVVQEDKDDEWDTNTEENIDDENEHTWPYEAGDPLFGSDMPSFEDIYDGLARIETSCRDDFEKFYHWYVAENYGLWVEAEFLDLFKNVDGRCVIGYHYTKARDHFWKAEFTDGDLEENLVFYNECRATQDEEGNSIECSDDEVFEWHMLYQEMIGVD